VSFQEVSPHDAEHPSVAGSAPMNEDVAELNEIIVPVGAYVDPHNPQSMSASVNLSLDKSPVTHSPDFGSQAQPDEFDKHMDAGVDDSPGFAGSTTPVGGPGDGGTREARTGLPEGSREEWQKSDWRQAAEHYGLAVSGNMDTLKERVEDYEGAVEEAKAMTAGDWKDQVDWCESANDLDDLEVLYKASGADFSTVESAFEGKAQRILEGGGKSSGTEDF
jgi:hypothetical protein